MYPPPVLTEEEKRKQDLIREYVLAQRQPGQSPEGLPPPSPTLPQPSPAPIPAAAPQPENSYGIADALVTAGAGLGDALSSAAGRQTNFKKEVSDISKNSQESKRKAIEDYLNQQKTKAEIAKLNLDPSQKAEELALKKDEAAARKLMAEAVLGSRKDILDLKKQSLSSLEAEREDRRKDSYDKRRADIVGRFNSDPAVKKAQQSLDAARTIADLATSGNPIAAAAVPTYAARMSGEVGALTEADKAPFGGSRAILARIDASLKQAATGRMTEENKKFILDLSNLITSRTQDNMKQIAKVRAKQYSSIPNYGAEDEIFKSLIPELPLDQTGIKPPQTVQPIFAVNKQTNQRIQSLDGGKTWQPAQ